MDKNKKNKQPQVPNITKQIIIAVLIFIGITIAYSIISKSPDNTKQLAISDVAKSITMGTAEKISVKDQTVTVYFKDKTQGEAKKETESSLSDTLSRYGVTPAQLANTPIEIANDTGFSYWLINILPFLPFVGIQFYVKAPFTPCGFWIVQRYFNIKPRPRFWIIYNWIWFHR